MSGCGGFVGKQAAAVCLPSVEGPACYIDYSSFVFSGDWIIIASVAMASLASSSSSSSLLFSSPLFLPLPSECWVNRHTPSFLVNVVLCVLDAEQLSYDPSPPTWFKTVILYLLVDAETTCWFLEKVFEKGKLVCFFACSFICSASIYY